MSTSLNNAVHAVNGVGAGGNIYAINECLVAFGDGVTPAQILDALRRGGKNSDRQLRSHESVVFGAWALYSIGDERLTPELAYKYVARIGATDTRAILASNADDKVVALETAWATEVDRAAFRKAERDALKMTATTFIGSAREQVNSLLALADTGVELSDEDNSALASLADDIRILLTLKVEVSA